MKKLALVMLLVFCVTFIFSQGNAEVNATGPVELEFMVKPWVGQPVPNVDNPIKDYVMEKFDIDLKLTNSSEFDQQILVRFASDTPPDYIHLGTNSALAFQLYDEGVLLEDWNDYRNRLPKTFKVMPDIAETYFSVGENLIGLTLPPAPAIWSYKIKNTWLEALDLEMPATPEDLLNVARAFTYDDPDGNGLDDTYGFTSAGGGQKFGDVISQLLGMWGPTGFYLDDNNGVQHPILDGNYKSFLDFVKTIVSEGLVDPDWYTQSWEQHKARIFNDKIGIIWYPGVIVSETENATGITGESIDWYESMPMPVATTDGGMYPHEGIYDTLRVVSKSASEDPRKMDALIRFLEGTTIGSESYNAIRWGVGAFEGPTMVAINDTFWYSSYQTKETHFFQNYKGAFDYGKLISSRADNVIQGGTQAEISNIAHKQVALDSATITFDKYTNEPAMLSLDPSNQSNAQDVQYQFEIKYVLGEADDYEAFMKEWLKSGGQDLLDEAEKQFRKYGFIK
jgi:putative aldouronate transport system substrate-binding protein